MSSNSPSDTASALCFSELSVQRFHGIDHGLEIDSLCGDVNVIYGPNASGKTTLARVIRALLWPDTVQDQMPIVDGRFSLDGSSWRVEVEGETCRYQRDRHPSSPPALPPSSHDNRYHLYLHDLLAGADGEDDFARLILQEAHGGVDVEGAAESLGFEVPSRRMSKTANDVKRLRSKVQEAESQQKELREREHSLDRLYEKRAGAKAAQERAVALEQALEVGKARRAHDEAVARVESFPSILAEVRGDEQERLETLQTKKADAAQEIETAETELQAAQATLEESRLPEEGLPEGHLEKIRSKVATLQEQERRVRERRTDLEELKTEEEAAWEKLSAGIDKETAASIDLPALQEVETHAKNVEELYQQRKVLEEVEALLEEAGSEASVEDLRDGLRHLHRWLQSPAPQDTQGSGVWGMLVLVGGVLVGVVGGLLVFMTGGLSFWAGLALILLGALVVAGEMLGRRVSGELGQGRRPLYEREYRDLDLDAPESWSRDAVEEQAKALFTRLREAELDAEKQKARERLQPNREQVEERADELEDERRRLAEETGVDPDVGSRSLSWLVERLSRWQTAHEKQEGAQAGLEQAEQEVSALLERIESLLEPYEFTSIEGGADAQEALTTLESARDAFQEARRDREQARRRKETAQETLEDAEAEIAELYRDLNLETGAEDELRALIRRHDEYVSAVETESEKETVLRTELQQLRRCEGYEEPMEEMASEDIERELRDAREEAEKEDAYLEKIKEIENKVEAARKEGTLEQRRAEYRERRNQLAQDRQRDYEKAAGVVIAELVQEETRDQGLPPVFGRAQELFADITNDRYELTLDRETTSFRAYDHVQDRSFSLDALSSGTKVQLLLSVRIAFVESQEQGCCAPLVLDETLANSDEERAHAIIDAVRTICKAGRQVIYLTAQEDEVQKWNSQLQADGSVECQVLSINEVDARTLQEIEGDGVAVPARRTSVEGADLHGLSHEELRRELEVPRWSPRQSVRRLHLWYLIESPPRLVELIEEGTRTWGQLRFQYHRGGVAATSLKEEEFRRVRALAQAVESWKEAWSIGRGKPVDRTVLERTEAVTSTFIDDVSDLADDLDGDAEALLRALRERTDERARGFRSSKADELEAYLREHGFLDPRDRLSSEDMWQHVLVDLASERKDKIVSEDELDRLFERLHPSGE